MRNTDTWHPDLHDIPAAAGLLTRIPVRVDGEWARGRGAKSAWAYPIVGLKLAVICIAISWILPPLHPMVQGLILVGLLAFVTGAMHEDGLADSLDGLWGGWNSAQRLDIMKDSRLGVYAVVGLVTILGLRVATIDGLPHLWPLIGIFSLSRAMMVAVMYALPHARSTGLSQTVGSSPRETMLIAIGIGTFLCLITAGVLPLIIMFCAAAAVAAVARHKLGGQTGDILGATQQISETAGLITLAALI